MAIIIALVGTPGQHFNRPYYVVNFDPTLPMAEPDMLVTTRERDKAKRFVDAYAAVEYWQTQHTTIPKRLDGHPNRPLTMYNVEFVHVADA